MYLHESLRNFFFNNVIRKYYFIICVWLRKTCMTARKGVRVAGEVLFIYTVFVQPQVSTITYNVHLSWVVT